MKFFDDGKYEIRTYSYTDDSFSTFYLWLVLADVLNVLSLNEAAVNKLTAKEPEMFRIANDGTKLINERGFYYLTLFASKTPEARKFTRQFMLKRGRLTRKVKTQVMDNVMENIAKENHHIKGGYPWLTYSY